MRLTPPYGHAEVLVDAPLSKVRSAAVDFPHYRELHHKFASARVVAQEGDNVDVYLKLPIKLGPVKLDQWEVMRFTPARGGVSSLVVEGRGVQGNMKEGHLVITARAVDERHTLVKVDLLLVPRMPAPQSLIDEELRDAATTGCATRRKATTTWSPRSVTRRGEGRDWPLSRTPRLETRNRKLVCEIELYRLLSK